MSAKAEIGWRRLDEQGERCDVYARRVGSEWRFFERHRRYEEWRRLPVPPLADWLHLLEAIERLLPRRRLPPVVAVRLRQRIRELFPGVRLEP